MKKTEPEEEALNRTLIRLDLGVRQLVWKKKGKKKARKQETELKTYKIKASAWAFYYKESSLLTSPQSPSSSSSL